MTHDEVRLRAILREELDAWGTRVGIDAADPMASQADFRHLRRSRNIFESSAMKAVLTVVVVTVTAGIGTLWMILTGKHP